MPIVQSALDNILKALEANIAQGNRFPASRKRKISQQVIYNGKMLITGWAANNGSITNLGIGNFYINPSIGVHKAIKDKETGSDIPDEEVVLTIGDAKKYAEQIDNLGCKTTDVKSDHDWTTMYMVSNRSIIFTTNAGTDVPKQIETIPCHNCGIVLPKDFIEVDHYMPQSGGEDLAVIKMLRYLKLTIDGPTGPKGTKGTKDFKVIIFPKQRTTGDYTHFDRGSSLLPNKWTTNDKGSAFLSLLYYQEAGKRALRDACMNSLINFAPLCSVCNKQKSNKIRRLPT